MPAKTLFLVPDTNVFIQCHDLTAVDWAGFSAYETVVVVLTRPVQLEIDEHKNKGKARVSRKARDMTTKIRIILESTDDRMVIRESSPRVELALRPELRPDPAFENQLDYSEPDNKVVGIVKTLKDASPEIDVRLLTQDTGPMSSAKAVGIEYTVVPESWRLPPEATESDKRIRDLEAQVEKLKQVEPECKIGFLGDNDETIERYETTRTRYKSLSEREIEDFLRRIRKALPIATDFGPREPQTRRSQFGLGTEELTPATEEEIAKYKSDYAAWLAEVEKSLRGMHETLNWRQQSSAVVCTALNEGARPGKDVLVTIKALGAFEIMPKQALSRIAETDEEETETRESGKFKLNPPPKVPSGHWKLKPLFGIDQSTLDIMRGVARMSTGPDLDRALSSFMGPHVSTPDANAFYYKGGRPHVPKKLYSLECEQWRHGTEPETFDVELHYDLDRGDVSGALEMRIEAENLSEAAVRNLPIRIRVKDESIREIAADAVERLTDPVYGLNIKKRSDA